MRIKKWIFITFLLFLGGSAFAAQLSEQREEIYAVAPFCKYYENLGDDLKVKELRRQYSSENGKKIYQYRDSDLELSYEDLVRLRYEGFEYRLNDNAMAFKRKLMYWVSYLSISNKSKYYESLDLKGTALGESRLESCLTSNVSSNVKLLNQKTREQTSNPIMYRALLFDNFNGAIAVAAILEKAKFIKKEFDKKEKEILQKLAEEKVKNITSRGPVSLLDYAKAKLRILEEDLKIVRSLREQALIAYKLPFYNLAQTYPMLFEYRNDAKILNWMNQELALSEFYDRLIADVDPVLWDTLKSVVAKTGDFNQLADIYLAPEVQPEIERVFSLKMRDQALRLAAEESATAYVNELNHHSLKLCQQSEDHKLHYNSQLVHSVFSQNTRAIGDKPISLHKSLTVKDQAGYCHLLKQDPPLGEALLRTPEKLGFSAFGAGMLHKFFTGKVRYAWSLYTLGSGAFLWNAGQEWGINEQLLNSTYTMLPQGFAEEADYHDLLNNRGNILTQAVWEVLFSSSMVYALRIIDFHYMRYLVKNYDVKKHEFSLPQKFWGQVTRGKVKQALLMGNAELKPAGFFKKITRFFKRLGQGANKAYTSSDSSVKEFAQMFKKYHRGLRPPSYYDPRAREKYLSIMQEKSHLLKYMESKHKLSFRLKRVREKLGYFTSNYDWPAYLAWKKNKSHIDLVVVALQKGAHNTKEGLEKLETLKTLLKRVPKTEQILINRIDMAFNSKLLLPKVKEIKRRIRTSDFTDKIRNGKTKLNVTAIEARTGNEPVSAVRAVEQQEDWIPISRSLGLDYARIENGKLVVEYDIMKNGRVIRSKKMFESKNHFLEKYKEILRYREKAVSNSVAQESTNWSYLMDDLYNAAVDHRVYEITKKRLEVMKENLGLSSHQEEILKLLETVSRQEARIDITVKVLFREVAWEFIDMGLNILPRLKKFLLGKRKLGSNVDETLDQLEKSSPIFAMIQSAAVVGVIGGITDVYRGLSDYGKTWHQRKEWVSQYWRDFWRWFYGGSTNDERDCAIEIPVRFHLCYYRLSFEELGYEWSLGIESGDIYVRNEELKRKARAYAYKMVKLRKRLKAAEIYEINQNAAKQSFHNTAIEELIERIVLQMELENDGERNINRDVLSGLVYTVFHASSDEELLKAIAKLKKLYDKNIVDSLLKAVSMEESFFKRAEKNGTIPVEILNLLERYQYDAKMDDSSLLNLFQGELIRASQMSAFDRSVDEEVIQMLENNTYQSLLEERQAEIDEGIRLSPSEEDAIRKRRAEKAAEEKKQKARIDEILLQEDVESGD